MLIKRILAKISFIIAVTNFILSGIARFLCADKIFLGLSALSFLWITNTMLLFTIVFLVLWGVKKKE